MTEEARSGSDSHQRRVEPIFTGVIQTVRALTRSLVSGLVGHDWPTGQQRDSCALGFPGVSRPRSARADRRRAIRDDGLSRNGTWVNGERLRGTRRLLDGDTIRIGRTLLVVRGHAQLDSLLTVGTTAAGEDPVVPQAGVIINLCGPLTLQIDGQRRKENSAGKAASCSPTSWPTGTKPCAAIGSPRSCGHATSSSPEESLNVHIARLRAVLGKDAVLGVASCASNSAIVLQSTSRLRGPGGRRLAAVSPTRILPARSALLALR